MRIIGLALPLVLGTTLSAGLGAQDVGARLDRRVSPEVQRAVRGIAADAAARGLPVDPLVQKAIEGAAKGVPGDRVIAAVRALAGRLAEAMEAVRAGGLAAPSGAVVEGGADALNAGISGPQVSDLVRVSQPPHDPALTLRVAATLSALGVPAKQALELVETMITAGRAPPADPRRGAPPTGFPLDNGSRATRTNPDGGPARHGRVTSGPGRR